MKAAPDSYRVNYSEGQPVLAAQLAAEQGYLIGLECRHNSTLHSDGVVLGLDIPQDSSGNIQPGVAVDNQGAILVLNQAQPAVSTSTGTTCTDWWLVRCETPKRIRHPGLSPCGAKAFDRWREVVRIAQTSVNDPQTDPMAPAPGAVYLGRTPFDSGHEIPFPSVAGAQVAAPRGDFIMLVGPENGRARDGFSVKVIGEASPRLAIDRIGTTRFHGDITLSDYRACAQLSLPNGQLLIIQAAASGAKGEELNMRIRPERIGNRRRVQIRFFSGREEIGKGFALAQDEDLAAAIKKLEPQLSKQLTLALKEGLRTIADPAKHDNKLRAFAMTKTDSVSDSSFFDIDKDISLTPCGGELLLDAWPDTVAAVPPTPRGCLPSAQSDAPGHEPNGLAFEPLPSTPKAPPLMGFYSLETGDVKQPQQQFRVDLGEKRDSDLSVRFTVGNRKTDQFRPWLVTNGLGVIEIKSAGVSIDPKNPPISLRVAGTIQRGPIKPDLADPAFKTLLALAWLAGLQRSVQESTEVTVAFNPAPPVVIETEIPWSYTVVVTNTSSKELTADGVLETQSIAGQSAPLQKGISSEVLIPAAQQKSFLVNHDPNDTPAGALTIEVRVFGKIGNSHWWRSGSIGPIPVLKSPFINLNGFPDTVAAGQDWQYKFKIQNKDSAKSMTVDAVTLVDNSGHSETLAISSTTILAGQSSNFGAFDHTGITQDFVFSLNVDFTWQGGFQSKAIAKGKVSVA